MPTAEKLKAFFAEVFADLDANPRPLKIRLVLEDAPAPCRMDLADGEPVFFVGDDDRAAACYRGRWLAEHPVPLNLLPGLELTFTPTTGNRVRVRVASVL